MPGQTAIASTRPVFHAATAALKARFSPRSQPTNGFAHPGAPRAVAALSQNRQRLATSNFRRRWVHSSGMTQKPCFESGITFRRCQFFPEFLTKFLADFGQRIAAGYFFPSVPFIPVALQGLNVGAPVGGSLYHLVPPPGDCRGKCANENYPHWAARFAHAPSKLHRP